MNAQDMPLLVQTGWLQGRLGDQDLRVFDCTVRLEPAPGGVKLTSGRDAWTRAHVPGAGFLDLLGDLSDRTSRFNAMLPRPLAWIQSSSPAWQNGQHTRG